MINYLLLYLETIELITLTIVSSLYNIRELLLPLSIDNINNQSHDNYIIFNYVILIINNIVIFF